MFKKILAALTVVAAMAGTAIAAPVKALDIVDGVLVEGVDAWFVDDGFEQFELLFDPDCTSLACVYTPSWLADGVDVRVVGDVFKETLTVDYIHRVPAGPTATDERRVLIVLVELKGGQVRQIATDRQLRLHYRRVFWREPEHTDYEGSVDFFFRSATSGGVSFPQHLGRSAIVSIPTPKECTVANYVDAVEPKLARQDLFYEDFEHVVIWLPRQRYTGCPEVLEWTVGDGSGTEFVVGWRTSVAGLVHGVGRNLGLTGTLTAIVDGVPVTVDLD